MLRTPPRLSLSKLGTTGSHDTFTWQKESRTYACNQKWSAKHAHELRLLLTKALTTHMPNIRIIVVILAYIMMRTGSHAEKKGTAELARSAILIPRMIEYHPV